MVWIPGPSTVKRISEQEDADKKMGWLALVILMMILMVMAATLIQDRKRALLQEAPHQPANTTPENDHSQVRVL